MHLFDSQLIVSFNLLYSSNDILSICHRQRHGLKDFVKTELYISLLKVMIVDLDGARQRICLDIDNPVGLPLSSPEGIEIQVDAREVNYKIACLVKANNCTCCPISI